MPCVAGIGEETQVRQFKLSDHLPFFEKHGHVCFSPEMGMEEHRSEEREQDSEIKKEKARFSFEHKTRGQPKIFEISCVIPSPLVEQASSLS